MFATQKICCKCDGCSVLCPKGGLTNDDPCRKDWARCDDCDRKQECQKQCPHGSLRISTHVYKEGTPNNRFVCVFACPTDRERDARVPVVGKTGDRLHLLMEKLREFKCEIDEEDVCIVNSSSVVHNSADQDSVVKAHEIIENMDVLYKCVFAGGIKFVLLFGKTAAQAWRVLLHERKRKGEPMKSYDGIRAIKSVHLSPRSMNKVSPGQELPQKIDVLAKYIQMSLNSNSELMEFEDYICAYTNQRKYVFRGKRQ